MPQQRLVVLLKINLLGQVVYRRRHPVRAMQQRHPTQLPESVLEPFAQARKALGRADRARFPVRIRQHEVVHHMRKQLTADRDPKLGHVREVRLAELAGTMLLNKEHLLRRSFTRSPALDPTLQGAQLAVGKPLRMRPLQRREDRFRLQPRIRPDLLHDPRPNLRKIVLPRPPVPVRLQLARQTPGPEILPRRLHIHAGLSRRYRLRILSVRQFVQPPYLLVCHHAEGALQALPASSQLTSNREK